MKKELNKPINDEHLDKVFLYVGENCQIGAGCGNVGDGCFLGLNCEMGNDC